MDSYLQIAEGVLRGARMPLTAREIIDQAYLSDLVPPHLFGKTQHKTLGARLSEDILIRRDRSPFFRTDPGRFFLREFLTDASISEKYRTPMIARRRQRELLRGRVLTVSRADACQLSKAKDIGFERILPAVLSGGTVSYEEDLGAVVDPKVSIWSFVVVARHGSILSYRSGRYREGRDAFMNRRTIGFFTPVVDIDRSLFNQNDYGVVASGIRAVVMDLDLPQTIMHEDEYAKASVLEEFILNERGDGRADLLAVVRFQCPEWFEPLKRRLAINDLGWLSLDAPVNHLDDFDPWSQAVLKQLALHGGANKASHPNIEQGTYP